MKGYLLLEDGTKLDGVLKGPPGVAAGWVVTNTAVVGFQEMATDPAYKGALLAFTYPEVGNVGVTEAFSESPRVQVSGLAVKVLSEFRSHCRAEDDFEHMLATAGVPCLCDVDTRGLAVHLREHGEMAAVLAPETADEAEVREKLRAAGRPAFEPGAPARAAQGENGPTVAVLNLGARRSLLDQLKQVCRPVLLPPDATAEQILEEEPTGLLISDGPALAEPPLAAAETVSELLGHLPILGCGLGHVTLGMALGCEVTFLKRGHHGANCPVRNLEDDEVGVTHQRHSVVLERDSVETNSEAQLTLEHINDGSVEGIVGADGTALGLQAMPAAPHPGAVNDEVESFIADLNSQHR